MSSYRQGMGGPQGSGGVGYSVPAPAPQQQQQQPPWMPQLTRDIRFRRRTGALNWDFILGLDLDRVVASKDLMQLHNSVPHTSFADITLAEVSGMPPANTLHLLRFMQLQQEYLINTQNALLRELDDLETKADSSRRDVDTTQVKARAALDAAAAEAAAARADAERARAAAAAAESEKLALAAQLAQAQLTLKNLHHTPQQLQQLQQQQPGYSAAPANNNASAVDASAAAVVLSLDRALPAALYPCTLCTAVFASHSAICRHFKRRHPEEPLPLDSAPPLVLNQAAAAAAPGLILPVPNISSTNTEMLNSNNNNAAAASAVAALPSALANAQSDAIAALRSQTMAALAGNNNINGNAIGILDSNTAGVNASASLANLSAANANVSGPASHDPVAVVAWQQAELARQRAEIAALKQEQEQQQVAVAQTIAAMMLQHHQEQEEQQQQQQQQQLALQQSQSQSQAQAQQQQSQQLSQGRAQFYPNSNPNIAVNPTGGLDAETVAAIAALQGRIAGGQQQGGSDDGGDGNGDGNGGGEQDMDMLLRAVSLMRVRGLNEDEALTLVNAQQQEQQLQQLQQQGLGSRTSSSTSANKQQQQSFPATPLRRAVPSADAGDDAEVKPRGGVLKPPPSPYDIAAARVNAILDSAVEARFGSASRAGTPAVDRYGQPLHSKQYFS